MSFQTEEEFSKDNGYVSRKFLLTLLSIFLTVALGLSWAIFGWKEALFGTIASTIVTLALGYVGISAGRSALPRYAQNNRTDNKSNPLTLEGSGTDTGNKEEL
tara:strand:- start:1780 stop:2088 length:309 start_codon:yes stop_codon:yes gene_type:complete